MVLKTRILISILLSILSIGLVKAAWYNSAWDYRLKLTVQASKIDSDLSNYPVFVDMSDFPSTFFTNVKTNGSDIRVTKSDGTTELAREIVLIDTNNGTGEMHFVANGTLSSSSDTDFYIYYGNSSAVEPNVAGAYGKYNTWIESFVAVWHLNESVSSASTVYDSTAFRNDGTTAGAMVSNDSVLSTMGRAMDFDGTDDSISIPHSGSLNFERTDPFTISSYSKVESGSSQAGTILSKMDSSSPYRGYDLKARNNTDTLSLDLINTWSSNVLLEKVSYSPATVKGAWAYLAASYNGDSLASTTDLFINDLKKSASPDYETLSATILNTNRVKIASRDNKNGTLVDFFTGIIDEVRVASVKRSDAWMKAEYFNFSDTSTFYTIEASPSLSSSSPSDNSVDFSIDANIVLNFDQTITIQNGDIIIKRASDDNVFETIDANSAKVTGDGTTQITINPSSNFEYNTSYYIQIDATSFSNDSNQYYVGISDKTTLNFSTAINTDTGDWSDSIKITIDSSNLSADLTNFPVHVNLSDLGNTNFFETVKSDGSDIRVTKSDGSTLVAHELEFIDTNNGLGELHFVANGTLSSSSDTDFYIHYGNLSATALAEDHQYGSQNVWIQDFIAVWHFTESAASAVTIFDSTANNIDGTYRGTFLPSVTGKLGKAVNINGNGWVSFIDYSEIEVSNFTYDVVVKLNEDDFSDDAWGSGITAKDGYSFRGIGDRVHEVGSSLVYSFGLGNTSSYQYVDSVSDIDFERWHNFTSTHSPASSGSLELFLDGLYDNGRTSVGNAAYGTRGLRFATDGASSASRIPYAQITEIRIQDVVRDSDWISANHVNMMCPGNFYYVNGSRPDSYQDLSSISYFPVDDSIGLNGNGLIMTISASQDLKMGSGNLYIKEFDGDTTVKTVASTSGLISGVGSSTIAITLDIDLDEDTAYYINYDSGFIKDYCNTPIPALSDNTSWNFTIGNSSPAVLLNTKPANTFTNVLPGSLLELNFDKAVLIDNGDFKIHKVSDHSLIDTIDTNNGRVHGSGTNQIRLFPLNNLVYNERYYVLIDNTAIKDTFGNFYNGITDPEQWVFKTKEQRDTPLHEECCE